MTPCLKPRRPSKVIPPSASAACLYGAGGGTRTGTEVALLRILSPLRMPFRHLWLAKTQKLPESLEFLDRPPLNGQHT